MGLPKVTQFQIEFPLVGPGGEPIDLWRTIMSHGVASLPPMFIDETARTLDVTVRFTGVGPRTIKIAAGPPGFGSITVLDVPDNRQTRAATLTIVRQILRLDEDLSPFYALAADDPDLSWV